jgi:hypothetical protein
MSLIRLYQTARVVALFALASLLFCILVVCGQTVALADTTNASLATDKHISHDAHSMNASHHASDGKHDCCEQGNGEHVLVKWVSGLLSLVAVGCLVWCVLPLQSALRRFLLRFSAFLDPDPPGGYPPLYLQSQRLRH